MDGGGTADGGTDDGGWSRRRYLRVAAGAGVAGGSLVGAKALLADRADDHPWFRPDDPDVLVVAHAGGKALRPDNTLAAFDHAVEVGADVLETDVHVTADGVPVCIHDETVDARTDGSGPVNELTLPELKALDGAHAWTPPGSDERPYRGRGLEVPTLAEAFEAHPDARWNVELKPAVDDVRPVLDVIRDHEVEQQVLVASFAPLVERARRRLPELATSAHRREVLAFLAANRVGLAAAYDAPAHAFQVPRRASGVQVLTPRFVEGAHSRGVDVHAWTINERDGMRRLADLGVDGLITDRPDRALAVLGRD